MTRLLDHWHARLDSHFKSLAAKRHSDSGTPPIFALEHGLGDTEFGDLSSAIHASVKSCAIHTQDHMLPWVVYAAELGYDYAGVEYWQSFEVRTPGWRTHGDRSWIRECYHWFHQHYGGAQPSGKWANWFTIICWPITHAILPKDLQRPFARVLYELRHSFSHAVLKNPTTLGDLVATRSWATSTRFQHFVQEENLVGQIAAALLLEDESETSGLIDTPTLLRIVRDLDKERRAREWLRVARTSAKERVNVHGLVRVPRLSLQSRLGTKSQTTKEGRTAVAALGIEPRIVLQPADDKNTSWTVVLEIPNLSSICHEFPDTQNILTQSRCRISGYEGRPIARGRFLYGAQRIDLSRWPEPHEVLLKFKESHPTLEFLLKTECLLRPGPPWLFRIEADGFGYGCRNLTVRPGQRYVILTTTQMNGLNTPSWVKPVNIQCRGIGGYLLNLPAALDPQSEEIIQNLDLMQSKLIAAWPAGLAPVYWDGQGYGEWCAGDQPTIGIESDHTLSMIRVVVCGQSIPPLTLTDVVPGKPLFVQLPRLPIGFYTILVDAVADNSAITDKLKLDVRVVEARSWHHGVDPGGPLLVRLDPVVPTLEQLWEGQVDIEIFGPHGREVTCETELLHREAGRSRSVFIVRQIRQMSLPITPSQWRRHFEQNIRNRKAVQRKYDAAHICRVRFASDDLGTFVLNCERDFTPLRWAVVERNRELWVQLLDDSGTEELPRVSYYELEKPASEICPDFAWEYKVPVPGGLYLARKENFLASTIVVWKRMKQLDHLPRSPVVPNRRRTLESVLEVVNLGNIWATAKSSGHILSSIHRRKVLQVIIRNYVGLIGGEHWTHAEATFENGGAHDVSILKDAVARRIGDVSFVSTLACAMAKLAQVSTEERVNRLAQIVKDHGVVSEVRDIARPVWDHLEWIAEWALRLASNPRDAVAWAAADLQKAATRLMEVPIMVRAARFVVLATHDHSDADAKADEIYAGWTWN